MNTFFIFTFLFALVAFSSAQQWTAQQLAAYRQQQYYNWWYNQQRMQQVQQQPQFQQPAPAQPVPVQSPFFGNAQSDSKGNSWHGDDNAKLFLVARSSWP
ncbi:Protein CBG00171 [Caenorhabditis briggsae]|uniref:Uncharacterized protein n=2 Tax=Caenorhabditis briggsae TaxID=6238 RepID=A0AAE9CVR6_CAEBR|nr:Protein CBG00171 [Caenorhabditis briggsae]ULT83581.1 hypothetical protein L3Y34_012670 [Caenorhabditis briggsae]UMM42855.1 hypothetical protein L5515_018527 [Caenorhabditis briggsae]CAP21650.1 Protein CBG00171 [Caenorhabditis briggsae]